MSRGCHALIRQGAELVTDADQVLDSIGWQPVDGASDHETLRGAVYLDQDQTYIFALLQQAPMTVDALLHTTGWPVEKIFSVIATLQLIGIVHDSAKGYIPSPS